jgi:hypothetical protein
LNIIFSLFKNTITTPRVNMVVIIDFVRKLYKTLGPI